MTDTALPETAEIETAEIETAEIEEAEIEAAAAATPHILVIDDATVVRMYYRQILEAAGYRVEEAINGLEALEKALRTPFDLCLVDVNMPVMDGYAFMRAMRREPAIHATPAMMTSTESAPQDLLAARVAGANFYLVKPVPPARLTMHVAALLGDGSSSGYSP